MEIEHRLFILSIAILAATASVYGAKFLGKGNYLLGVEWLVVALSGAGILVFALGGVDAAYRMHISAMRLRADAAARSSSSSG